ncbi:MAG TPA: SigE family RNA polymerase sigma factor [Actinomycetota bacterium]|nr:SigE family RNA polymerase sigma factor [Actinomycetota bacterium]
MSKRKEDFREFFEMEIEPLRQLAYRLTRDWDEAEDLAQEALVRTFRAWDRIREAERPGAYARTILINRHRSLLRRALIEAKHLTARATSDRVEDASDPDAIVIWDELMRMPLKQRQAVVLHYFEDLPQIEVAHIMQCPYGTVNSLVHRGLARLRARLEPESSPSMLRGSEA